MGESEKRSQLLVVKTDAETILKMTKAYESLRESQAAIVESQRAAQQRVEEKRRTLRSQKLVVDGPDGPMPNWRTGQGW